MPSHLLASIPLFALALNAGLGRCATLRNLPRLGSSGFTMTAVGTGVRNMTQSAGHDSELLLNDVANNIYLVDIELAGGTYTVQLDSGSSDLWIFAPNDTFTLTNSSELFATETYGIGKAEGTIVFGELALGQYTVPSQAFIDALSADGFNFFKQGAVGILGLSSDDANLSPINSVTEDAFGSDSTLGQTPLSNIFVQNLNIDPSFDVLLGRTSDLKDTSPGTFLISEHLNEFSHITSQPRLRRQARGRWSVPLDRMVVNGQTFSFNESVVSTVLAGKIAVLLDTGFTFPPLPPPAVDAIYSTIPGAVKYDGSNPQWIIPCNTGTNLTFTFGGEDFPVHYLDLTTVNTISVTISGKQEEVTYCTNTYQYLTQTPDGFDAILGDAFLRNAYASFTFGDNAILQSSFVQLIPTTNLDDAWYDFAASRAKTLSSLPPTIDPATLVKIWGGSSSGSSAENVETTTATSSAVESPSSSSSDSGSLYSLLEKYGPVVIGLLAGNVLVGLLLRIIGLTICLKGGMRSGARARNIGSSYTPVRFKEAELHLQGDVYRD